jgi:hypothetical protein
LAVPYI